MSKMSPPPKYNQFPKTGKLKKITTKSSPQPTPGTSSGPEASQESVQQQFELELCWCIEQLEINSQAKNFTPKQHEDFAKTIKVLKSTNQPIVKKRLLMRNTFGDYREKMLKEQRRMTTTNSRVEFTDNKATNVKSQFLKRAIIKEEFKFDFQINLEDDDEVPKKKEHLSATAISCSDNTFRFNFDNNEQD